MHCLLFNFNKKLASNARALGCYRIAHYLREHGWDVEVIEYAAFWDLSLLKELAKSRITENTKWIGTSHMFSVWGDVMEEFCLWVKQTYPWIKVVSGSSADPVFESRAIDYYIQGYGENAILELLKYLFSNGKSPMFSLLTSGARKIIPANSHYPAFPMKSLMVKYQDRDFILPGEHLGIEFARGCKFKCSYCNFPVLGVKGDYTRDAEDFHEQVMDAYNRWGVTGYYVADETFNDRTEKITKFADVVETLPFTPWFTGYVRADLLVMRPKDREEMARMGFRGHFYGIESFTRAAAKAVGKGINPDRLKQGLLDVKKYFENTGNGLYRAGLSFIFGLANEKIEDIERTISWVDQHWARHYVDSHVLTIPRVDSNYIKKPAISTGLNEYGYQEMSHDEINAELSKGRRVRFADFDKLDISAGPFNGPFVMWKTTTMNVFDAAELEEKVYQKWNSLDETSTRGIDCFGYSSVLLREIEQMSDRIKVNAATVNKLKQEKQPQIVNDYIHKKLSL